MAAAQYVAHECRTDAELVERVRAADRAAFDTLYDRYFPRVLGYVRRRIDNSADVEEAVQDVFTCVFTALDSFRGEAPFAAWVLGVARNTVAGRFKRKRHATVPLDLLSGDEGGQEPLPAELSGATPLDYYECAERLSRIDITARKLLTEEQRQVIELHHLQHRSVREIAGVLGRSEDAVKSNLYRARKLLLAS